MDYSTPDLSLAAFLVSSGHPLLRVEGTPGSRQKIFALPASAAEAALRSYQGAQVPAWAYWHAVKDLKVLIHQAA